MKRILPIALFAAAFAVPSFAQTIFSGVGGVCMNVEGGVRIGARVIGWPCAGGANEKFVADGSWIKLAGTNDCLTAASRSQGAELHLEPCSNNWQTQNFAFSGNTIKHNTGYCVDLKGAGWYNLNDGQNKPVILWSCNGGRNQAWFRGGSPAHSISTAGLRPGTTLVVVGQPGTFVWNGSQIVSDNGGGVISHNGGNVIGQNGASVLSHNGGNIIGNNGAGIVASNTSR